MMRKQTMKPHHMECVVKEVRSLRDLSDSNLVIKLLQVFESDNTIYLILEYVKGGDLHSRYQRRPVMNPKQQRELMKQLLEGLRDMHKKGYIHRDIKPRNVILAAPADPMQAYAS